MEMASDEYFDLKSLASYSKLGISTLRHHIRANGLPCFQIPGEKQKKGKILVKRSEFDNWLEKYRLIDYLDLNAIADSAIATIEAKSDV